MMNLTELVDRLLNRTPDRIMSVQLPEVGTGPRIDLAAFLRQEGWPSNAITAHATGMFATAVKRRYERERGEEPPWDRGYVYEGYADWLIVRDTYNDEIGAIAERLALEELR